MSSSAAKNSVVEEDFRRSDFLGVFRRILRLEKSEIAGVLQCEGSPGLKKSASTVQIFWERPLESENKRGVTSRDAVVTSREVGESLDTDAVVSQVREVRFCKSRSTAVVESTPDLAPQPLPAIAETWRVSVIHVEVVKWKEFQTGEMKSILN